MKYLLNSKNLPYAAAGLGCGGLVLRWCLYSFAVDERNLILSGHPLSLALVLLSAAAVALLTLSVWKLKGSNRYADNFRPSSQAAVGAFVLAAGILLTTWQTGLSTGFAKIRGILGVLAAVGLIAAGISRQKGRRPLFLFHLAVCVYFTIRNISYYRTWSSNPQILDYVFSLLGGLTLMLFSYYQTSFDVGSGRRRMQLGTGLLSVFFCLAAVPAAEEPVLYMAGAVWAFTNLCALDPAPRRRGSVPPEAQP